MSIIDPVGCWLVLMIITIIGDLHIYIYNYNTNILIMIVIYYELSIYSSITITI